MRYEERKFRRNRRDNFRQPQRRRSRRVSSRETRLTDIVRLARSMWQTSTPANRILVSVLALAGLSIAAVVASFVVQVAIALTFGLIPLVMAPLLFTFAASTGFVFVSSPLFFLAVVAKAVFPIFAVVALITALLHVAKRAGLSVVRLAEQVRDEAVTTAALENNEESTNIHGAEDEDDAFERPSSRLRDELDEFDRLLRYRTSKMKTVDVENWNVNEVIDELDACGLGHYRQLFIEERIDGHTLLSLTDADIRAEFANRMPLGDRRRLSRLISSLQKRKPRPR